MEEDKAFSSIDFVGQCLVDEERTVAFQKAINNIVKKGDSVLDLGTGSGIMALSAAKAGAGTVTAVEFDPFVAKIARNAILINNLENTVSLVVDDARICDFQPNQKFDVVISEMLTTAMVDEPQIAAINNLHDKNLVDESTIFVPCKHDTYISLVNANFTLFGLHMPMIMHLWHWHKWSKLKIKKLTEQELVNSISFHHKNEERFEATLSIKARKTGTVNALYLTSKTFLSEKIVLGDTEALNAPMLIPISEIKLVKGQTVQLKISYTFGGGYQNFKADFI